MSSGRMAVRSDSSAMRADRFDERTAENVATASTSVPPAVANEAIVVQSAMKVAPYRTTVHSERTFVDPRSISVSYEGGGLRGRVVVHGWATVGR